MKSGIEHIVSAVPVLRSQYESEEHHNLTHGNAFPASPVERQLFYRDDEHLWYQYNGTEWVAPATEAYVDAKVAADIGTHADLTTGIHGLAALHAAGFHSAGQAVSKGEWKDASVSVVLIDDQEATIDWTEVDVTAQTSANAKLAELAFYLYIFAYTSGRIYCQVRKHGTTPDFPPMVEASSPTALQYYQGTPFLLGLDSEQKFDYTLVITGVATVHLNIVVMAYVE